MMYFRRNLVLDIIHKNERTRTRKVFITKGLNVMAPALRHRYIMKRKEFAVSMLEAYFLSIHHSDSLGSISKLIPCQQAIKCRAKNTFSYKIKLYAYKH